MNEQLKSYQEQVAAALKKPGHCNTIGKYHSPEVLEAWDSLNGCEQSLWLLAALRELKDFRSIALFASYFNEPEPEPFLEYRRKTGLNLILPSKTAP